METGASHCRISKAIGKHFPTLDYQAFQFHYFYELKHADLVLLSFYSSVLLCCTLMNFADLFSSCLNCSCYCIVTYFYKFRSYLFRALLLLLFSLFVFLIFLFYCVSIPAQFIFFFSGCGPSMLSKDHLAALKHFFDEEKKGIFLWGEDSGWLCEANQVGTHLLNTQVVWNGEHGGEVQ